MDYPLVLALINELDDPFDNWKEWLPRAIVKLTGQLQRRIDEIDLWLSSHPDMYTRYTTHYMEQKAEQEMLWHRIRQLEKLQRNLTAHPVFPHDVTSTLPNHY